VIYGKDNRNDVVESRDSVLVELSKSTAAMIDLENLKDISGEEIVISSRTLKQNGICAKERFSQQISAANCSGFLVAPNILVTAGHCIKSNFDCTSFKWVFDYKVDHSEQREVTVPKTSVYSCKKIISRSLVLRRQQPPPERPKVSQAHGFDIRKCRAGPTACCMPLVG
jgi:hypothetical protein